MDNVWRSALPDATARLSGCGLRAFNVGRSCKEGADSGSAANCDPTVGHRQFVIDEHLSRPFDAVPHALASLEANAATFVDSLLCVDQLPLIGKQPPYADAPGVEDFLIGLKREDCTAEVRLGKASRHQQEQSKGP
jgi:hypothetical protein